MSAWLNHPLAQSGVVPFIVAFVIAWLLRPHNDLLAGLGFAIASAIAVYLIAGFHWAPLTSTRKIILASGAAFIVGLVMELFIHYRPTRLWLLALGGAGAALWLIWPLAMRKSGYDLWVLIIPAMAYSGWLVAGLDGLNEKPINLVVASFALSTATAIAALFGASALLGQLGGAVAAAIAAYVLVFVISGEFQPRAVLSAPATTAIALLGIAAMTYARLPWTALVALACVPALGRLPVPKGWGALQRILLVAVYTFPAGVAAVWLTWRVTGSPSF